MPEGCMMGIAGVWGCLKPCQLRSNRACSGGAVTTPYGHQKPEPVHSRLVQFTVNTLYIKEL